MAVRVIKSLESISSDAWDQLDHGGAPFLSYGFLRALEVSGSVGPEAGWDPRYLLIEDTDGIAGAVAAYVKTDSYGEYIFDWAWANASQRAGIPYYPKLVVAAPFTPATGPRILIRLGSDKPKLRKALVEAVQELSIEEKCHSTHWLFVTEEEREALKTAGFALRDSFQFHWRNKGYSDFEEFISAFTSRKRKQCRKERRRAREAVDEIDFVKGADLTAAMLKELDTFYRINVARHGGFDYLRPGFFEALVEFCPEKVLFARAHRENRAIAGAFFLEDSRGLYGRYWGALEKADCLHFEVAYYAAIERCINQGVSLFEAGAQGEHKLLRGFEPAPTYSAHLLSHEPIDRAVRQFLMAESKEVKRRMEELASYGPYRQSETF